MLLSWTTFLFKAFCHKILQAETMTKHYSSKPKTAVAEKIFTAALPADQAAKQEDKMKVGSSRETLGLFLSFQAGNYADYYQDKESHVSPWAPDREECSIYIPQQNLIVGYRERKLTNQTRKKTNRKPKLRNQTNQPTKKDQNTLEQPKSVLNIRNSSKSQTEMFYRWALELQSGIVTFCGKKKGFILFNILCLHLLPFEIGKLQ